MNATTIETIARWVITLLILALVVGMAYLQSGCTPAVEGSMTLTEETKVTRTRRWKMEGEQPVMQREAEAKEGGYRQAEKHQ